MYKHECVQCLIEHYYKCPWNISFYNRFFGTDEVKYCVEYAKRVEKTKELKRKRLKK